MGGYPKFGETEYSNKSGFYPTTFDKDGEPVDVLDIGGLDPFEARKTFGDAAMQAVEEAYGDYLIPDDEGLLYGSFA